MRTNVECRNDLPLFFACCDGIFIIFLLLLSVIDCINNVTLRIVQVKFSLAVSIWLFLIVTFLPTKSHSLNFVSSEVHKNISRESTISVQVSLYTKRYTASSILHQLHSISKQGENKIIYLFINSRSTVDRSLIVLTST